MCWRNPLSNYPTSNRGVCFLLLLFSSAFLLVFLTHSSPHSALLTARVVVVVFDQRLAVRAGSLASIFCWHTSYNTPHQHNLRSQWQQKMQRWSGWCWNGSSRTSLFAFQWWKLDRKREFWIALRCTVVVVELCVDLKYLDLKLYHCWSSWL